MGRNQNILEVLMMHQKTSDINPYVSIDFEWLCIGTFFQSVYL